MANPRIRGWKVTIVDVIYTTDRKGIPCKVSIYPDGHYDVTYP